MYFLDVFLGSILTLGFLNGLWKGFLIELASTLSLLLGLFIAVRFSGFTADFIRESFNSDFQYLEFTSFLITFILVLIGVSLSGKLFTKLADFSGLGLLNKILGGLFGILKALLILSVFLQFFDKTNQKIQLISQEKKDQSILYDPVLKTSRYLFPILTDWFGKQDLKL